MAIPLNRHSIEECPAPTPQPAPAEKSLKSPVEVQSQRLKRTLEAPVFCGLSASGRKLINYRTAQAYNRNDETCIPYKSMVRGAGDGDKPSRSQLLG
jgi:hypothetical protein